MRYNHSLQYTLAKWRVLVVDESVSSRKMLTRVLKDLGLELITEVSSGQEALIALDLKRFDLVISEWEMPDLSGIELLKTVRQLDGLIPFLIVNVHCTKDQVKHAIEAGVTDFISKPYAPSTIESKIEAIIGRKHKRRNLSESTVREAEQRHKTRLMSSVPRN